MAIKGLGRTRPERHQRKARRMWKFYMRRGWYAFIWPALAMHNSQERSDS